MNSYKQISKKVLLVADKTYRFSLPSNIAVRRHETIRPKYKIGHITVSDFLKRSRKI